MSSFSNKEVSKQKDDRLFTSKLKGNNYKRFKTQKGNKFMLRKRKNGKIIMYFFHKNTDISYWPIEYQIYNKEDPEIIMAYEEIEIHNKEWHRQKLLNSNFRMIKQYEIDRERKYGV